DGLPLDDLPPSAEAADTAGSPDDDMEQRETWAHVRRVLARLPEAARLTLTLHYLSDWPYADIAEFLDVPITTVVGRMHRARRLLQERLEPMVRETFQTERLADAQIAAIVAGTIDKAKDANERWERATFLAHADEALAALDPTSSDPEVARGRVEILGMRGDARATWIGDVPKAVEDYLHAIATADEGGADEEAARLCKELVAAYLRSGQYEPGRNTAQNAQERLAALGDSAHEALMVAAADLCDELPGVWAPGDTGGYVMAAFPVRKDDEGITFEYPVSIRNYTWGAPSPSAALAWLLHPVRVLASDISVGSSWEDRIDNDSGHNLLWRLRGGHELVAVSTVESVSDDVVTPAGRFTRCLRVRTAITAPDGRVSPDYTGRARGGARLAWYAPGVGCVKARHDNQNHQVRTLALVDCHEPVGEEYLPMQPGVWWRYQWTQGGYGGSEALSIFEDVVRVIAMDGETTFLSSATMAAGESDEAFDEHLGNMLDHERESRDDAGLASFLDMKVRRLSPDDGSERDASVRELAAIYERVGDARRAIEARWRLAETDGKLDPDQRVARARELAAAAEADGSWEARSTTSWLLGVALRDAGHGDDAQTVMRASAAISADAGDVVGAANGESWPDRFLLEDAVPPDDMHGYANGEFRLVQEDDVIGRGDSSTRTYHGYPPGPVGTTLTHFPLHRPYSGFRLVDRELGATHSVRNGLGASWGSESMMTTHTVTDASSTVTTPGGSFDGCVVIESKHELNV
ncbi:MAG: RNA polymerase sigma factor, partial [Candidatus Poribacteria bacterium]